jgi:hypothetical protein
VGSLVGVVRYTRYFRFKSNFVHVFSLTHSLLVVIVQRHGIICSAGAQRSNAAKTS